jgi:hypothetical protein
MQAMYHQRMGADPGPAGQVQTKEQRLGRRSAGESTAEMGRESPEIKEAIERRDLARDRLLSAAIAFCDGTIGAAQLRAVREFLREQDLHLARLTGRGTPPFVEPPTAVRPVSPPREKLAAAEPVAARPGLEQGATGIPAAGIPPQEEQWLGLPPQGSSAPPLAKGEIGLEIAARLAGLDRKVSRLEQDFSLGRVNPTQYQAIRRHYTEQREVALRLHANNPKSDRWRVVLEEGRTEFILQLNEAACLGFALYDIKTRHRIYLEGTMGQTAEEAMALLGTFGPPTSESSPGLMLATRTDDGNSLLLIPGRFTAALITFSEDPPGWQVRALREVHRNFEAANAASLARGERRALVFPDVGRIVRT